MGNVIEAKDPRGIRIYCTEDQWMWHIVASTGHPVMAKNIDAIVETISFPDYIFESHDSEPPLDYREVYVKETKSATYYNKTPYTKVIASVCGGSGEIITTYNASNIANGTKGEAIYCAADGD